MEMNKVTPTNFLRTAELHCETLSQQGEKKSGFDTGSVCKLRERLSNSRGITSKNLAARAEKQIADVKCW